MFNLSKNLAFGMDLSDISLKIFQFSKNKEGFFISSFVKSDIPIGIVEGGEIKKADELISIFKKAFAKPTGLPFREREVICSLPEEKVFIRVIKLPKMKRDDLANAVKWEAEAHIPLSIDEVYLSWQVIDHITEDKENFNVLIAAIPKYVVDSYLSFLKKVKLSPIAFEPESLSVVRSLLKRDDSRPTIIVDIGATGTNYVIFAASAIRFTSHGNVSGNLFNQEIMKKMKVSEKKANELKIKVGLDKTKESGKVYKALEPTIDDLTKKIKDYIAFYYDHSSDLSDPDKKIANIILCGGDSHLLNLPEHLNKSLNLPVGIGDPFINISINKKNILSKKDSVINTTAIGLALRQVDSCKK